MSGLHPLLKDGGIRDFKVSVNPVICPQVYPLPTPEECLVHLQMESPTLNYILHVVSESGHLDYPGHLGRILSRSSGSHPLS